MKNRKIAQRPRQDSYAMCMPTSGYITFTLNGEDPLAAPLVRAWADQREAAIRAGTSPYTNLGDVTQARACADLMDRRLAQISKPGNVERLEPMYFLRELLEADRLLYDLAFQIMRDIDMCDEISMITFEKAKRTLGELNKLLVEDEGSSSC